MLVAYILTAFALLLFFALLLLHLLINNRSITANHKKAGFTTPKCVLAVFAHPDDEIMVCGSLAKWKRTGAKTHLLYLTHGEDGPTGGLVEQKDLGAMREKELKIVQDILQVDSLTILNYPDRYLNTIDRQTIEQEISAAIQKTQPDTLISFDNTIGLYGHSDHAYAGICTQAVLARHPQSVQQLLVMTLCPNMIRFAKKVSKTFRERYRDENGLPEANFAIPISGEGKQKKQVCLAHKTQHQVVGDVQPLGDKMPYSIYYRIFSREYYSFAKTGTMIN